MHCAVMPYASRFGRVKAAAWLTMAGHMGGAVWGHFTPREESTPLYMQMKLKDPSLPLDMIVQNSAKSRILGAVVCPAKRLGLQDFFYD